MTRDEFLDWFRDNHMRKYSAPRQAVLAWNEYIRSFDERGLDRYEEVVAVHTLLFG